MNLYGALSGGIREALIPEFEKAYPGIKVNGAFAPSPELISRIVAENEAKKPIADVIVGPATQSTSILKPAGIVGALEPGFILPEVKDVSAWRDSHYWWIDAKAPFTTLGFQGWVGPVLAYNSKLVDPKQFSSFQDLLKPEWKGKIVVADIRVQGSGSGQARFIYKHPEIGPAYLNRLFGEMQVTLSAHARQMVDWIGQGRYLLGLWVNVSALQVAQEQQLPVVTLSGNALKEGAPLVVGGGTINLAAAGPHPNAAKLFVNRVLSREGQLSWQRSVRLPSLRIDYRSQWARSVERPQGRFEVRLRKQRGVHQLAKRRGVDRLDQSRTGTI